MKKKFALFPLLLFFFFSGANGADRDQQVTLLQSNESGLVFEVRVPAFTTKAKIFSQGIFQILDVEGLGKTSEIGKPLLPLKGALVQIPPEGRIEVEVLDTNTVEYPNYGISPCPLLEKREEEGSIHLEERFAIDRAFYRTSQIYPPSVAELGFSGYIRERRVAQIKIHPFQYNPATRILYHHKRILLKVQFEKPVLAGRGISDPHFDAAFKDIILNFEKTSHVPRKMSQGSSNTLSSLSVRPSSYKIEVDKTGIYKITQGDLAAAGVSTDTIDAQTLKIFCQGKEVAIHVSSETSTFGSSDYILFYGEALDTEYTDTNVYWLSWGGSYGKRMAEVEGKPGSASLLSHHYRKDHFEENNEYWISMPDGKGKDHWFWERINAGEKKSYTFSLNKPANGSLRAAVRVTLFGRTSSGQDPDHHVVIFINRDRFGQVFFDGQTECTRVFELNQSKLKAGANTLEVKVSKLTGLYGSIYLNHFDVEYYDSFVADDSLLAFDIKTSGRRRIQVSNLAQESIGVFDITNHDNVKRVVNLAIEGAGGWGENHWAPQGSYKVSFERNFNGNERFLALAENAMRNASLEALPSSTLERNQDTDYIIITHEDFYEEALSLAEYRESQGLAVRVIKVRDIYDKFNNGIISPQAIKDFLSFAYYEWNLPSYVLFLGDANVDARDYTGTGRENFIPTYLYDALDLQVPNDNWFFCISEENDDLPDYFSGRITAKSAAEAHGVIQKIVLYDGRRMASSLEELSRSIFVADDGSSSFPDLNDELATDYFPSDFEKVKIYLDEYNQDEEATADLKQNINFGALTVNYVGHGSYDNWAGENIFLSSDVDSLHNSIFPFVVCLTCLNGFFANWPREIWDREIDDCLAESFVNASGKGAIAAFAPTGLGYTWEHRLLGICLYELLFQPGENATLGMMTTQAKIDAYTQGSSLDQVQTFVLFGDPVSSLGHLRRR
ncbi:MAG: hypothetical protein GTO17_07775 [Candidatus Aminicenantes bacterium]|nr:hypothetical protein [Candidatus Aminicenantes bacterium]